MSENRFEEEKFEELVLYVAERCLDDPSFGATKLNKILFFSDFLAYQELGHPITGARYMRLDYGPAPRELLRTLDRLEERGRARRLTRLHFGRQQKRLVPLDEPHLSMFTAEEIALVDDVVETVRHSTAVAISDLSHRVAVGWQLAGHKEDIPYESVFLSSDSPSPRDLARGQELAEEHDWATAV